MKPWIKTGIFWTLWMFTVMTFVFPYLVKLLLGDEDAFDHFGVRVLINAVVFSITGLYIGYRSQKKKARKQVDG
ncbi:hypothetical protein ACLI1A_07425 [Flavobacterium sp. RHBU_3]|uniref:hypothetical protein n=1 Tax=Flavobacterium sp. RHBU_3 TaxID=3391184 RepID=UPI0039846BE3